MVGIIKRLKEREAARKKRKDEFDEKQGERRKKFSKWRKKKAEENKSTGYNGSRKSDRNIDNRKNANKTAEEELEKRAELAVEMLKVDMVHLKDIIKDFDELHDPRNQKYIVYTASELLLFGLLSFRFHAESRRDSNAIISPVLWENIRDFFPMIDEIPHADTLGNLLERMDADEFEQVKLNQISRLIRNKKLDAFRMDGGYLKLCLDGVHKFTRDNEWSLSALESKVSGKKSDEKRYYASALEASLILPNGHTLPVMTEFMDRHEHGDVGTDTEKGKQDCETNAGKRLIKRLRALWPNIKLSLTMDSLYATGPMLELCREENIDVMIVFKETNIPTVWEEVEMQINKGLCENKPAYECNGVRQEFFWVNGIEYIYGEGKVLRVNVAVCKESRTVFDKKTSAVRTGQSVFAWISLRPFTARNVEERCNSLGRARWNIESQNSIEKCDGYNYSHCFSYNWNAMRIYHFLMQIAHILNNIALLSTGFAETVKSLGFKRTIRYLWSITDGARWDATLLREKIPRRYQIRWAI